MWNCLMLAAIVSAGSSLSGRSDASADLTIYTTPQRLVEIAPGRALNLVCLGVGSPTVVFDIGVGDPAGDWALVQPPIAARTRTCSYDRAGIGFSQADVGDGSSAEIVADLKHLLTAAKIEPPYVLVGQSYGGMNVRLFYYTHPKDVAGIVLVEPSHEDQNEGFRMLSPRALTRDEWDKFADETRELRARCIEWFDKPLPRTDNEPDGCVVPAPAGMPIAIGTYYEAMQRTARFQRAQGAEEEAVFGASVTQLQAARRGFGELPVIVLSRSPEVRALRDWETVHLRSARYRYWLDLHRQLADASSRGEHRIVPESDHHMMLSQPAAVIDAVEDILDVVGSTHRRTGGSK